MQKILCMITMLIIQQIAISQVTNNYRQDSLRISLKQAEDSFLSKNLSLLAQHFSIDSARATVITAKLYDNPEFNYATNFYQPESKKFFDLSNKNRETAIQISQLIKTAGKRTKAVTLATSGIDLVQNQFYDLLRNLRFTVRNDFYNIYYLENSERLYELEINSLKSIVPAYEQEEKKGFVSLKDVLRIKSQLYTLQAEFNDLQTNIDNIQAELKLLIRANPSTYLIPQIDSIAIGEAVVERLPFQSLVDTALANRPDLKALQSTVVYNTNNLVLQKALAKPDINLNLNYDRQGSYVKYFNAIGFGIPIPIFNRNQGNIKNAQIQIASSQLQLEAGLEKVKNELSSSYITALRAEKLLSSFDPDFDKQLERLTGEVFKNFKKRNITMLEFLDSYESYKQNVLQLNKLRFNKMSALEQLNFSTGTLIFNK